VTANTGSFARYTADVLLYRALRLGSLGATNRLRRIAFQDGSRITYRLNRGDVQSIREIYLDEVYRLPFQLRPDVVIDLGAHIGLTSVFLAKRYGSPSIIAVEPDPSNAQLARANVASNNVRAEVIEAAVGPKDGAVRFQVSRDSNRGHIGARGLEVPMVSMDSLLEMTPDGRADLVKMDIEGGEEDLLSGDIAWLSRVRSMIIEFHPGLIDYGRLVGVLQDSGFRYVPAGSAWRGSMDAFIRDEWPPSDIALR
jgi:FkbM family methyltransferase